MRNQVKRILEGQGARGDLKVLLELGATMKATNKCGLGQTAMNPVVSTITNFPELWEKRTAPDADVTPGFDLAKSVAASCQFVGRTPNLRN